VGEKIGYADLPRLTLLRPNMKSTVPDKSLRPIEKTCPVRLKKPNDLLLSGGRVFKAR